MDVDQAAGRGGQQEIQAAVLEPGTPPAPHRHGQAAVGPADLDPRRGGRHLAGGEDPDGIDPELLVEDHPEAVDEELLQEHHAVVGEVDQVLRGDEDPSLRFGQLAQVVLTSPAVGASPDPDRADLHDRVRVGRIGLERQVEVLQSGQPLVLHTVGQQQDGLVRVGSRREEIDCFQDSAGDVGRSARVQSGQGNLEVGIVDTVVGDDAVGGLEGHVGRDGGFAGEGHQADPVLVRPG